MDSDFSLTPEAPVLVIGSACVDIVGRLKDDLRAGTSNPAHIRTSFGGVARNVAENLARLGQPVRLVTVVGSDQNGDRLVQSAAEAGIDIDCVMRTSQHPTGSYLGVIDVSGKLQLALDDMRAIATLLPDYLKENELLFREASVLFLDANLPKETLRTAVSLARKARLPICADPASAVLADKLKPYLKYLRLITPNSAEASILTDLSFGPSRWREALQVAKNLVGQGVEIVIIALAEFGVCYATAETSGHIPAIQTTIVDPTGAGDAMTATVLFSLLNGMPIDDAVRLGVSAASLTLGNNGTVLPDLSLEILYDHLVI